MELYVLGVNYLMRESVLFSFIQRGAGIIGAIGSSSIRRKSPSHESHFMIGKVSSLICVILVLALPSSVPGAHAQLPSLRENEIKAAFLYNFVKFTEWPAEAFPESSSLLTVGVLDDRQVDAAFKSLDGKIVRGRKLRIKRIESTSDLESCHIVFIRISGKERVSQILVSLQNSSVLTVGEMKGFAQLGGIINFYMKTNRLRFEINVDAAKRAELKMSSKLLKLAKVVEGKHGG